MEHRAAFFVTAELRYVIVIRKYYYTERIANMWNSLPDAVNSPIINQFKNKLDRHWPNKK